MMTQSSWISALTCSAMVCTLAPGCVVLKSEFEALKAQHQAEQGARKQAHQTIAEQHQTLATLQQQLAKAEERVDAQAAKLAAQAAQLGVRDQSLAEVELQVALAEQRQQASEQLVRQLRTELSRVSEHLKAFAADKERLGAERQALVSQLEQTEHRLVELEVLERHATFQASATRALALGLRGPLHAKTLGLDVTRDYVELTIRSTRVLDRLNRVTREGKKHLTDIGKVLTEIGGRIELSEPLSARAEKVTLKRLQAVAERLVAEGVERTLLQFDVPKASPKKVGKVAPRLSLRLRARELSEPQN